MTIPEIVYEHYLKVPVVQKDQYTILLEQHLSGTFIHCVVTEWSKSAFASLKQDFESLCKLHGGPIHALHDASDRKHEKFLKMFGFTHCVSFAGSEELWIWRNNG